MLVLELGSTGVLKSMYCRKSRKNLGALVEVRSACRRSSSILLSAGVSSVPFSPFAGSSSVVTTHRAQLATVVVGLLYQASSPLPASSTV